MFKELQISVYDIFGYLFPGAIVLLALALVFQAVFWPHDLLIVPTQLTVGVSVCFAFLAYVVGHLAQGVGNLADQLPLLKKWRKDDAGLSPEAKKLLRAAVSERFGPDAAELKFPELVELCDQTLVHHGSVGEREIFTYREGFYRGCFVGLALLSLGFLLWAIRTRTSFVLGTDELKFGLMASLALSAVCVGCAWIAYRRYTRFADHRIRSCLIRFLAFVTAQRASERSKPNG